MFQSVLLDGDSGFFAQICTNAADYMKAIGSYVILILGLLLIIMAIYQVTKGFIAKGNANWAIVLGCLLFGGVLIVNGWRVITSDPFGSMGKNTLDNIMDGGPTALGDFDDAGSSSLMSIKNARKGLGVLSKSFLVPFGSAVIICVGVCLVIIAIYQVAKYFMAGGRSQISAPKLAAMAIIGSVLFTATPTNNDAGWIWIRDVLSALTKDTVVAVADGTSDTTPVDKDLSGGNLAEYSKNHKGADPSDVDE